MNTNGNPDATELMFRLEAEIRRREDGKCRIAIAGGPHVGKTTLANSVAELVPVTHTDAFMDSAWADQPELIMAGLKNEPRFLVEGVQIARCLRKGLAVDIVIWLERVHTPITVRQRGLAKGTAKIFREWLTKKPEGVVVLYW